MMRQMIIARAELLRRLRRFFDERGFYEVQPPTLCRDCVVDTYLDPIAVPTRELGLSDPTLPEHFFLQTSPESSMKRMLADGAPSIYSIGPVHRRGESGSRHSIEFTMLEWYELAADADAGIALTGRLVSEMLSLPTAEVVTYRQAFLEHAGVDPLEVESERLQRQVAAIDASLAIGMADDRDGMLDVILSHVVQPRLPSGRPVIVRDFPLSQAALAPPSAADPRCAGRFELFVDGLEIANGYDELVDADEVVRRAAISNQIRVAQGRRELVCETTLVAAMRRGLPACCGVALGVDRLLMLATRSDWIDQVIPLPTTIA